MTNLKDKTLTQHTPSPWYINHHGDNYVISTDKSGFYIIALVGDHAPTDGDMEVEAKANALLIAAAPDLLEALEQARHSLRDMHDKYDPTSKGDDTASDARYALNLMDAAIAKAKGK